MKTGCYEPGEIGRLADLAADDPACRHFATCVRCRGLLASYRSFMAAGERPATPDEARDEERLAGALAAALAADGTDDLPHVGRAAGRVAPPARPRRSGFQVARWSAWAAVLVLAVGGGWYLADRSGDGAPAVGDGRAIHLRSGDGPAPAVPVVSAVATDGGGWRLTWRTGLPGSTYRVRVLDAALREVTLLSAGSDTALAVAGDVLTGRPDTMFWQVDVLRDGDVVARSDLHPFSSR